MEDPLWRGTQYSSVSADGSLVAWEGTRMLNQFGALSCSPIVVPLVLRVDEPGVLRRAVRPWIHATARGCRPRRSGAREDGEVRAHAGSSRLCCPRGRSRVRPPPHRLSGDDRLRRLLRDGSCGCGSRGGSRLGAVAVRGPLGPVGIPIGRVQSWLVLGLPLPLLLCLPAAVARLPAANCTLNLPNLHFHSGVLIDVELRRGRWLWRSCVRCSWGLR